MADVVNVKLVTVDVEDIKTVTNARLCRFDPGVSSSLSISREDTMSGLLIIWRSLIGSGNCVVSNLIVNIGRA